jgi:hypothetical protein
MFRAYSGSALEAHLYPFPWDRANDVFHVATFGLAALGLLAWTRTSWRSAAWLFTVSYLLLLLFAFNRSGRYLIPLYPVLILGLLQGAGIVMQAVRRNWSTERVGRTVASGGALTALAGLVVLCAREPRTGGYLHEVPEAEALFAYVEAQPPGETRVAFTEPRVLSWRTGVPATVIFNAPPRDTMDELDRLRITLVVLNRIGLENRRVQSMRGTIAAHPCRFEPAFDNGSFEAFRVLPPCEDGNQS